MTAEMIIPSERMRDLTSAPRHIPIEVEGSVIYEIPVVIWSTYSSKNTHTAHDLGEEWHKNLVAKTSDDLADEITTLGGHRCVTWLAVASFMLAAPHPHDPDHVLEWLAGINDSRLRRWFLGYITGNDDQALIEQAAEGDLDVATDLVDDDSKDKTDLVEYMKWMLTTDGLGARFATTMQRFRTEVFAEDEEAFAGAIGRAAAAVRAAPTKGTAKDVVEEVTSGIDFEIPPGTARMVLLPSVVTRPLSLIDVYRGTLIVYYGLADEFINSDPEAPPSWLVRTYKALSDDRRLRILRRVSEEPASLDDLSEMLGLTKSTVHHHIAQLRGAGLIRVHVPADKSGRPAEKSSGRKNYSVREESLAAANEFLDSYLRTNEEEKDHV